jgi:hypothetical protein
MSEIAIGNDDVIVGDCEGMRNEPGTIPWVFGHWNAFEVRDTSELCGEGEDEVGKSSGIVIVMYFVAVTVCLDLVVLVVDTMSSRTTL